MISTRINIKQIMEKDMLRLMPDTSDAVIIEIRENEHRFTSDFGPHSLVLVHVDPGLVLYKVQEYSKIKGTVSVTLAKHRCVYSDELVS